MRTIALCLALCPAAPAAAADLKPAVPDGRRHRLPELGPGHPRHPRRGPARRQPRPPGGAAGRAGRRLGPGGGEGGAPRCASTASRVEAITRGELASPEVRGAEARLEALAQEDHALDDRIAAAKNSGQVRRVAPLQLLGGAGQEPGGPAGERPRVGRPDRLRGRHPGEGGRRPAQGRGPEEGAAAPAPGGPGRAGEAQRQAERDHQDAGGGDRRRAGRGRSSWR